jgi:hypothetical protein
MKVIESPWPSGVKGQGDFVSRSGPAVDGKATLFRIVNGMGHYIVPIADLNILNRVQFLARINAPVLGKVFVAAIHAW